ncbi:hypothetical protein ACTFIY_007398 [Dictyostelium cf. discoideum]
MAETFINKTIETNLRFLKPGIQKQQYSETVTKVIKACLEDQSLNKINSLKSLLPAIDEVVLKESPICGYLMYILADSCRKCNLYEDSVQFGNQSLHIREILYGGDSNEVCICLDLLGLSMLENNQYDKSSKVFIKSFKGKAEGGYTTFSQLVLDIHKYIQQTNEQQKLQKQQQFQLHQQQYIKPTAKTLLPITPSQNQPQQQQPISPSLSSSSLSSSSSSSSSSLSNISSGINTTNTTTTATTTNTTTTFNNGNISISPSRAHLPLQSRVSSSQCIIQTPTDILINTLNQCNVCLTALYYESLKDTSNQSQERTTEIRKALISISLEQSKLQQNEKKYLNAIQTYQEILTILNNSGLKEEKLIYEALINTFVKIDRYEQVKNTIELFIQMGIKSYKVPSIDIASVLWFCGKVLEEQSDRTSSTKLCDLVDSLRYYLCTFKISREIGGVTIGEESTAIAQKKIREKIETILYNNRPLKPEEVLILVDGMIRSTTTEFLLNGSKSQNWLLKYVYPDFMAEDALREKFDTLPSKSGFLFKMNGLMKSWKTRWFSLERDVLFYYKYNNDPKPQGELIILEIKSIEILPKDKKFKPYIHCFQLVHPKHTLLLAAESEDSMKEWVAILTKAKQYWEDWSNISLNL